MDQSSGMYQGGYGMAMMPQQGGQPAGPPPGMGGMPNQMQGQQYMQVSRGFETEVWL